MVLINEKSNYNSKNITIKEIAKIAGASKTTVSRVISNSPLVSKQTKEKILKIIEEKKYKPSRIAQCLRTKKTKTLGLILADIENPFYTRLAKGVLDTAIENNYDVIISNSDNDITKEEKEINSLIYRQVDGLLITTVELKTNTIEKLLIREMPFLLIDCKLDTQGVNYITNDNYYGAKLATKYLIDLGHKKILFVGNEKLLSFKERYRGFKDVMKEHNIFRRNILPERLLNFVKDQKQSINVESIVKYLMKISEKPTAIFVCNDYVAISLITIMSNKGIKIPEDISIIGYDNIKYASSVGLTTIRQSKYLLGKLATEELLKILENENIKETRRIILMPDLIVRRSCAKLKEKKENLFNG